MLWRVPGTGGTPVTRSVPQLATRAAPPHARAARARLGPSRCRPTDLAIFGVDPHRANGATVRRGDRFK